MVTVQINTRIFPFTDEDFVYRVAGTALHELDNEDVELTISLVGNEKIRELNREYRQMDEATDVLSFSSDETNPETGRQYLGDVVISFPKVKSQARQAQRPVSEELATIIVHGILHLHGYDHSDHQTQSEMFKLQGEILKKTVIATQPIQSESIASSFKYAILGILSAFRSERNMWIHLAAALLTVASALWLRLSNIEWGLLIFAIALVVTTEMVNTALEYLLNLISKERNESVRRIKDISAAAVLIATLSAVMIGLLVFLPRIAATLK